MAHIIIYIPITQGIRNSNLIEHIKTYPTWAVLSAYSYIIKTDESVTSVNIRENLTPYLRNGDKLLVAALSGKAAWRNLDINMSNWLKKNL